MSIIHIVFNSYYKFAMTERYRSMRVYGTKHMQLISNFVMVDPSVSGIFFSSNGIFCFQTIDNIDSYSQFSLCFDHSYF